MLRTQTGRFAIQAFAAPIKALFIAVILYFGSGCSSSTKSADAKEQSAAGRRDTGQKVDIYCLGDHVSNPSDSFHYSFKATDEQNAVDKEADVTPQTMVVTIQDKSGSHTYHGTRSDEGSWGRAVLDLSGWGMTVMIARIAFIKDGNSSSIKKVDTGTVNGYVATHYAIDTGNANAKGRQSFAALFGAGSYDKGEIWTTADGCPVKLLLEEAKQMPNGTVSKTHFEINVIKK